ncbi:MAG: hypothetical protein EZS28_031550 [Streblomastix strix]|uniref:Uncharacterized protein n=1 Tax=Streblomastix strix TaxID=222440 RepID=A0A5J4URV5_9EUKA|nr:MAG: hypothetical protein EZS28_031550 [Streblomastix strix]
MERTKRVKKSTPKLLTLEQFYVICQEKMKSVEKYINQTHFASENDKQQAIHAVETKLHKKINELGIQNQINSIDISDCINALGYDYDNDLLVDDVIGIENIEDNQFNKEQQGIDENLYDNHEEELMIHKASTNETSTTTQSKDKNEIDLQQEDIKENTSLQSVSIISDEDEEDWHFEKTVVDIDVDKKLDESNRKVIRDDILQQLNSIKSLKVGLVQTAHGGIHIYCDIRKNKLRQNSMYGIIKSIEFNPLNKRYGVDVFACVTPYNEELQVKALRWIVLPESRIKDKDSDIELQYSDLNHMWNISKLSDVQKVFKALNFDMTLILNDGKPKEIKANSVFVPRNSQ